MEKKYFLGPFWFIGFLKLKKKNERQRKAAAATPAPSPPSQDIYLDGPFSLSPILQALNLRGRKSTQIYIFLLEIST